MSTFYLVPPRPQVAQRFAEFLANLFPGLNWSRDTWQPLAEALEATTAGVPDVYVVYREDLPADVDPRRALIEAFGAEAGDRVVEVLPGTAAGQPAVRHWEVVWEN